MNSNASRSLRKPGAQCLAASAVGVFIALVQIAHPQGTQSSETAAKRLVFSDDFTNAATIAENPGANTQAKWFRTRFFNEPTTPSTMFSVRNGILTMRGTAEQGANLQTAGPSTNVEGWKGTVFRKGAYFEARIAVGRNELATKSSWPAFWAMAVEHMALRGAAQWPGQPKGIMRFIESDIFEYNPYWGEDAYYVTVWEWFGRWQQCQRGRWCDRSNSNNPARAVRLPADGKFANFHVYGQYWIPATRNKMGAIQNYLDGVPVGPRTTWALGEPKLPATGHHLFNVIDRQGLVLVLATGGQPMYVDWVRVWQSAKGIVDTR